MRRAYQIPDLKNPNQFLPSDCTRYEFSPYESEFWALQEKLLSVGWHEISVTNIIEYRNLITIFLKSSSIYSNIGYLTTQKLAMGPNVDDIFMSITNLGLDIEEFVIEHCYYDLILIENSANLKSFFWFDCFIKTLKEKQVTQRIPVITLKV